MAWVVLGLGTLGAVMLGVVVYAGSRMGRAPAMNPAAVLSAGGPPSAVPALVCLGDSIAQGGLGADWVGQLRERLSDGAFVVNAGVGGQVTWDLRQRLDEVARCRPGAVVLMVGSNDAVGALGGGWASFYERGRPQAPSEPWFAAQFDALVGELMAITPRLVCLTLPPLGEDPMAKAESIVQRLNRMICKSAADHGADVIDVHAALLDLKARVGGPRRVPFLRGLPTFMAWGLGSNIRHHVLGRSWDAIGEGRGLALTTDTIHPNDRSATVIADRVAAWSQHALGLADTRPRNKATDDDEAHG